MVQDRNPQATHMGDESMARTLSYQAEAIWPQERPLFERYGLSGAIRIVDVGCGTGEITRRLAACYPEASLLGLDILESNLRLARSHPEQDAARIEYRVDDAFALGLRDNSVDLVVCRHMSQSVPDFPSVLVEFRRVLRPGGWLHLLSEDYGMLHFSARRPGPELFDPDRFWNQHAIAYLAGTGCDGRVGRHSPALLMEAGYTDVGIEFLTVDTLRVSRPVFAGILRAWRDGYAATLAQASGRNEAEVVADMGRMIAVIETPPHYAVWHVPVICGRTPG